MARRLRIEAHRYRSVSSKLEKICQGFMQPSICKHISTMHLNGVQINRARCM